MNDEEIFAIQTKYNRHKRKGFYLSFECIDLFQLNYAST